MTCLWLDDFRDTEPVQGKFDKIVTAKNYKEFTDYIENNPMPDYIFFDHDLGEEKSGYDCAKFLIKFCMENNVKLPQYRSQSANVVGKNNILGLLKNYEEKYENIQ